ncbi:hypothetical protein F441_22096 [Phytophthora nicotianae CJ01A1]|uniref:Uncharacterized protein n=3 Tax=Phytophthora nicotianae TaxID=4792 RepID=W2L315_PHYNI|nr:hypothetical protein L915_01960 [Phytophthora nicotianae]ETL31840.1 hypothetical protein L916_15439 [Phytophthora nicotianae]ETL91015.1 hypothetical protein L917_10395 [Phytophthora nicotianae]ETO59462.1 hypothetical protein F444_22189 [Phytophthora nicotianae P1976]ETP00504.1 hypothetical protein F441_22096 [Phytophthora nicotianae CJ01A1]
MVNEEQAALVLNDVLYVPGAEYELLSPGRAVEQVLDFEHEPEMHNFRILDEGVPVAVAVPGETP